MAEASKCFYCHIGTILWIYVENEKRYILQCSYCSASGEYKAAQSTQADDCTHPETFYYGDGMDMCCACGETIPKN